MPEQIINEQEIRNTQEAFENAIEDLAQNERTILNVKIQIARAAIKMREQDGFVQGKNEEERAAQLRNFAPDLHASLDEANRQRIDYQENLDVMRSRLTMCDRLLKLMEILKG